MAQIVNVKEVFSAASLLVLKAWQVDPNAFGKPPSQAEVQQCVRRVFSSVPPSGSIPRASVKDGMPRVTEQLIAEFGISGGRELLAHCKTMLVIEGEKAKDAAAAALNIERTHRHL